MLRYFSVVSSSRSPKDRRTSHIFNTGTLIGLFIKMICKAWRVLFKNSCLHRMSNANARYNRYGESQARFLVLSIHLKRYILREAEEIILLRGLASSSWIGWYFQETLERQTQLTISPSTLSTFGCPSLFVIPNYELCVEVAELDNLAKYVVYGTSFCISPILFWHLLHQWLDSRVLHLEVYASQIMIKRVCKCQLRCWQNLSWLLDLSLIIHRHWGALGWNQSVCHEEGTASNSHAIWTQEGENVCIWRQAKQLYPFEASLAWWNLEECLWHNYESKFSQSLRRSKKGLCYVF